MPRVTTCAGSTGKSSHSLSLDHAPIRPHRTRLSALSCLFHVWSCLLLSVSPLPGLQGGPHNHTITALATALKQAKAPEYIAYQKQVFYGCWVTGGWGLCYSCGTSSMLCTGFVVSGVVPMMSLSWCDGKACF